MVRYEIKKCQTCGENVTCYKNILFPHVYTGKGDERICYEEANSFRPHELEIILNVRKMIRGS